MSLAHVDPGSPLTIPSRHRWLKREKKADTRKEEWVPTWRTWSPFVKDHAENVVISEYPRNDWMRSRVAAVAQRLGATSNAVRQNRPRGMRKRRVVLCAAPAQEHPWLPLPHSSSRQFFRSSYPRVVLPRSLSPGSIGAISFLGADRLHRSTSVFWEICTSQRFPTLHWALCLPFGQHTAIAIRNRWCLVHVPISTRVALQ